MTPTGELSPAGDITQLLKDWAVHEREVLAELMPLVFDELRQLARAHLAGERPDHTLQPTALVNELYLKLSRTRIRGFENRTQFFGFAARLMREILVDHARARRTVKRGGRFARVELEQVLGVSQREGLDIEMVLAVDEALVRLESAHPRHCRIAELRYFGGLTVAETARALGVSQTEVERSWGVARRWLAREIQGAV